MTNLPGRHRIKAAGLALVAGVPTLICALSINACSTSKAPASESGSGTGNGSGSSDMSPFGNGSGTGGRPGGFGGGGGSQTGGFFVYASMANPATGVVTTAPAQATPTMPTDGNFTPSAPTGVNEGGFRIQCTTDAGTAVNQMTVAMKTVKSSGQEYNSQLSFKSNCSDFARITVSQIAAGDVATLTVKLATLAGVTFASGTTSAYTQAAAASTATTTANASGTGGRPNFTPPTATEVAIAMKPVSSTSSGTSTTTSSSSSLDD